MGRQRAALSGFGEMNCADVPRTRPTRNSHKSAWKSGAGRASEVVGVGAESSSASSTGRSEGNASRVRTEGWGGAASVYPGAPGGSGALTQGLPRMTYWVKAAVIQVVRSSA